MADGTDPEPAQVLGRQLRQDRAIDVVIGERLRVLLQAKPPQPIGYISRHPPLVPSCALCKIAALRCRFQRSRDSPSAAPPRPERPSLASGLCGMQDLAEEVPGSLALGRGEEALRRRHL